MRKTLRKLLCALIGHNWLYMDGIYARELDGRWCQRCDREEGERISDIPTGL